MQVVIPTVMHMARSWHLPRYADALYGLRLLQDGPRTQSSTLAITRTILHTNEEIAPLDALALAAETVRAAEGQGLQPEFLAATLLQESAYDPRAISSAGAIGVGQFMLETAESAGVNPFDPFDAIAGSAKLLGSYVHAYEGVYPEPIAAALAAYNAGPAAVAAYRGVPPYAETRQYINDVMDRWAKITGYEKLISTP